MQRFSLRHTTYEYSVEHEPIGTVRANERFLVECIDTWSQYFRQPSDFSSENRAAARALQWAVTGPISVAGVTAGGAVAVRLHEVAVTGPGVAVYGTYGSSDPRDWWEDETGVEIMPVEDGQLRFDAGLGIPIDPLVGCLATIPAEGTVHAKMQGRYGGNLDSRDIRAGATLILPAAHVGGGLYFGDCKALVADGEVVTAPECDAVVTASAEPLPRPEGMVWPRIVADDRLITLVSGRPLEWAAREAFRELMTWLCTDYRLSRSRAALLMGMVGHVGICQVSNTDCTASCSVPRDVLVAYDATDRGS